MKGFYLTKLGYVVITAGENRGRYQHIVVCEESLGRPLLPTERVHHADHNRQNNHPDNLYVCRVEDHDLIHDVGLEAAKWRLAKRGIIYERPKRDGPFIYTQQQPKLIDA